MYLLAFLLSPTLPILLHIVSGSSDIFLHNLSVQSDPPHEASPCPAHSGAPPDDFCDTLPRFPLPITNAVEECSGE